MSKFDTACARLYAWALTMIRTEPVRVRAWLTAALMACAVVFPALAAEETAASIAGAAVIVVTVAAGESARKRVTPVTAE